MNECLNKYYIFKFLFLSLYSSYSAFLHDVSRENLEKIIKKDS